jgi:putative molybdopterin biosynthesis protein
LNSFKLLNSIDPINILTNPHRQKILQLLMAKPMTVSQLGRDMSEYPAGIRHHVMLLEKGGLVVLNEIKASTGYIEKYYRATAQSFLLQKLIVPKTEKKQVIFMGSHDLAFEAMILQVEKNNPDIKFLNIPIGSLDGLLALRQGLAQITGCHIIDSETGQYNYPYIKRFFPDRPMITITIAHREQGLILAQGNPKSISGLDEVARKDISFVNRNPGSGTRIWLDNRLKQIGISTKDINGYTQEHSSHSMVAKAIKFNSADVGLGLKAAAVNEDLDYIPLLSERYDLVIPMEFTEEIVYEPILDHLTSAQYRQSINSLAGYDPKQTGDFREL